MKVQRIALQEFRKFRDGAALEDLAPGLNIFAGPNEAGKSTYVMALRAAFLERYGTSKVADFAPHGLSGARPSVTVEFEHAGRHYALHKQFLQRARCELSIDRGATRLEGDAAEQALAQLLGFEMSARGQSKPEHAGVPGLLWIEQGSGQELAAPAVHAGAQLRAALTQISGELASSDGDRLYARVGEMRAALLDARGGKPKGPYKAAEEQWLRLQGVCDGLRRERAELDADVDRLAQWRHDYDAAEREAPWLALEEQARRAREQLQALAREQEQVEQLRREAGEAARLAQALREQAARDRQDEEALRQQQAQAREAAQAVQGAAMQAARSTEAAARAEAALQSARQQAELAQQALQARQTREWLRRAQAEQARLQAAGEAAVAAEASAGELQARWQAERIDTEALERLRQAQRDLDGLRLREQAVATRIHHQLAPGVQLELGGATLQGDGELLLSEVAELRLQGLGLLRIEPGGRDLPGLRRELAAAQARHQQALEVLQVADLAQAEARAARADQLLRERDQARAALVAHAPQGLPALRAAYQEAVQNVARLQGQLAQAPAVEEGDPEARLAAAQDALRRHEAAWQQAERQARAAEAAHAQAASRAALLRDQLEARQAVFEAAEQAASRAARAVQFSQAEQAGQGLAQRCAQAEAALAAQRPDLVRQDEQRYSQSAQMARQAQQERHARLLQLQGRLEQAGAQGVGERLAQAEAELERAARRRDDYARHAAALDLLWRLLGEQRESATRRLLQPLAERLAYYLELLMPGADLRLDEQLLPVALARQGGEDGLADLSFGTREQLGLLARLAYADLLQAAGRPTLLVLDDALVHADAGRRDQIKRALFDAATRHQILLFTCHAPAWQDMGVPLRNLA